jgi:G2/mitotic-specific cyclin 1/2
MNENDENGPSTRLTRAKSAALTDNGATKKPLQTKRAATTNANGPQRRTMALKDVSNVNKGDDAETKAGKKGAVKPGLTSKATTQTGAVQKLSRTNSSRAGPRDNVAKKPSSSDIKRSGSGPGAIGSTKKRPSSQKSIREEPVLADEPPRKKIDSKIPRARDEEVVTESVALAPGVVDLDTEDLDDPLMVA